MDVEIKIDPAYTKPKIIVLTSQVTSEITNLVEKLADSPLKMLVGYAEDHIVLLDPQQIITIYSQHQKVYADLGDQTVLLKHRLYELEDQLKNTSFQRISNSEIINFDHVHSLDMGISGTICISFNGGETSFVSRRYISKIKEFLRI